ncbi:centromere protein C isoform X2 [Pyxicephalus adspersus]|uniref:centromere protein C isoform X2 n=1 Tax=Pyxicephalus adspersus TaxID=30357 RepID=UPI003B58C512
MGDGQTLDQLKNQYRRRFYRDRIENLPELRTGTNVLSAIGDYFNNSGGEESPCFNSTSILADSVTTINAPETNKENQVSSSNPGTSKSGILHPADLDVDSDEEIDDYENDLPLNLVLEKVSETEIVTSPSNVLRDRMYSSDSSAVQGPPSPAPKHSPQKRLRFSDAVVKEKEGFASIFSSRYKRPPADDVPARQMLLSKSYAPSNKNVSGPSVTTAEHVAEQEDDEFIIEDEHSINMSFSLVNKKSSVGSSKETNTTTPSSARRNPNLQHKTSEVISEQSPVYLSSRQSTRKENNSNVNRRDTTDVIKNAQSNERLVKETKLTPLSAILESQKSSVKSKAMSEQSLPCSKSFQQTRQENKEVEMAEEDISDLVWDPNRERIKIPRSKAERSKSSSTSHQMLEIEPAKTVSDQAAVKSQTAKNTLRDDTTKDKLWKDANTFTSHLAKFGNSEPPVKRMDVANFSDLPVTAEDEEFVIHDTSEIDSGSENWNKKPRKIPNDNKKNKKKENNIRSEVHNVTYISAKKTDDNKDSRRSRNDATDSLSPVNDKKKSRPTEVERLAVHKYLQVGVDNQNQNNSSRPKRVSAPPSTWWVVNPMGRNSTFVIEEALPQQSPKSKRKASGESKEPSEWQRDKEESFELKEGRHLDQYVDKPFKESNEKILNSRKRTKKIKPAESEEISRPLKVKKHTNQARNKSQTSTKKSLQTQESECSPTGSSPSPPIREAQYQSPQRDQPILDQLSKKSSSASGGDIETLKKTKTSAKNKSQMSKNLWKQLHNEIQESNAISSHNHDLNAHDLPSESGHLSTSPLPSCSSVNEPQCPSPSLSSGSGTTIARKNTDKSSKKLQKSTKKTLQSTKRWRQQEHETQESNGEYSPERDLNAHDLPSKSDHLSTSPLPSSSSVNEPQCPSPQKHPSLEEQPERSSASGSGTIARKTTHTSSKKLQKSTKKSLQSTKHWKQQEHETQESNDEYSPERDLNARDLPSTSDHLSTSPLPSSSSVNEPQCPSPQKHPNLDKHPRRVSAFRSPINARKKTQTYNKKLQKSTKKSVQSTKLWRQQEHETQESNDEYSEHDLNAHESPNKMDCLPTTALPTSPQMSKPQYQSPQRGHPVLDNNFKKSSAETEEQPHDRRSQQSTMSPAYDPAKSTFQSGPVLKTRAMRHNNQMSAVVRNLTSVESLDLVDQSPLAVVRDPETNSDALAECIHRANSVRHSNPSMLLRCFNNNIFSAGKIVLGPMEEEMRDTPQCDILVYYIVTGRILLTLHKSHHSLKSGDFFFIPPCNTYHIQNNTEVTELIFTQLKSKSE